MHKTACLSRCILGTAGLGGVWGSVDSKESIKTILMALESGITSIDTAPAYGNAEEYVGMALQHWKGHPPILSTKTGRNKTYDAHKAVYDFSNDGMEKSIKNSLLTLGVPTIDILFLHDPSAVSNLSVNRVFMQMSNFKKKGYATKIGLGGNYPEGFAKFNVKDIFDVLMEFNRIDACCDDLQTKIVSSQLMGMEYYIASPLHMGLLGNRYEEFIASPPASLEKRYLDRAIQVKQIADKYQLSLASLAHRFLLSLPVDFKLVIGPTDSLQLHNTIRDLEDGQLPATIMNELMN